MLWATVFMIINDVYYKNLVVGILYLTSLLLVNEGHRCEVACGHTCVGLRNKAC